VKVAVTGASGFIGRHVVAELAAGGITAVPVGRPFLPETLADTLRGAAAVVHLAGVVSAAREADYFTANVEGTRAVAEAARRAGVRMVHISSLAAAGPAPASAPRSEDDPPNPITTYGRSKLESERVIERMAGLNWIALRPGVVYGPRDRAMLPLFTMAAKGFLPLVGRADAAYSMIHVADCVRAIAAAITSDVAGQTIFVCHPRPVSVRNLLDAIRGAVNPGARVVAVPNPITRLAALAGDFLGALRGRRMVINSRRYTELTSEGFACRVDRLRDRLGVIAQIDLDQGLRDTARWYCEQGWLARAR
jgi:nucleoside-diphosphate-sugar epimerase